MNHLFSDPIPGIGTKGVYTLAGKFATAPGELIECTGIRTLSDLIANNDDPYATIYSPNGLTEDEYNSDLATDMEIVTFANDRGFIRHVPANKIISYPKQDGIYYHGMGLMCALPLMRVDLDLQVIADDVQQLIMSRLGVESTVKLVETTAVRVFDIDKSAIIEAGRTAKATDQGGAYATIARQALELANANERIRVLEQAVIEMRS